MATTTFTRDILYRGLLGCGFLLLSSSGSALAQRETELNISGGASLTHPAMERQNLTRQFRTVGRFNTGAALRLVMPLNARLGVGFEQRVTGLPQSVRYGTRSTGFRSGGGNNTVHQSGLSLRIYDIWRPGPRFGLDMALTGSYAWLDGWRSSSYEGPLWYIDATQLPQPGIPLVLVRETERRGTAMAGVEALLRYELGLRHMLLLTATYQRGLGPLEEINSTKLEYIDDNGIVQQGSLAIVSRGSYATVQLGYGLRLGYLAGATRRNPTPRYSLDPDETDPDTAPETE
ncbi:hypothetical protein [Hymenobacter canadensis]|uniref:Uncharacterized protein n=1 Tax=Hymenobacter canadensis TaxID=2999067 RepID=A0ABY7LKS8_9BACT|nr:hypothetical protein [Hymenobacter canadensis]WBA40394.1 hypothetical protein O3303_11180 [Hymenobacter canadensis]